MATFVTSDLHLGHAFVAGLRGFDSVEEHDKTIVRNIKRVADGHVLFILGDIALGGWRDTIGQMRQVNAEKHVILGNHDRPFPGMTGWYNHMDDFVRLGGFKSVNTVGSIGRRFMLSHFPYDGDHTSADRCERFRLRDAGRVLLHGHTHSTKRVSFSHSGTLQLHVGLDAWDFRPVALRELDNMVAVSDALVAS